ncbi:MAG: SDR family oxidoreductase [Polyangiaceae bacterium]
MSTYVITGANRGIGLELARQCKARGDTVVAVCRKSSPELDALGVRVESGVDVAKESAGADLKARLGKTTVDVLVHNAGVLVHDTLANVDENSLRTQFEVNAMGPVLVTKALAPLLTKGSKIAIVTSRMGSAADNSSGGAYGYRMSKAAVNIAGVSLAVDLKKQGVAVVIVHPGFVKTDMTHGSGNVEPADSAKDILARIDALTVETSGKFLHANGETLPW